MTKVKLSIIILSWNTAKLLRQCLESLMNELIVNELINSEVIVVDNGSTDESVREVKNLKLEFENQLKLKNCKLQVIENKTNLGFSKGNNVGIKAAAGEYVMLLNSDTIVKEGALKNLVNFLDENPNVDIVGPKLLNADGSVQANCGRFPSLPVCLVMLFKEHFGGSDFVRCSPPKTQEVDWLMGAAFVARKKVFEKIGGLDEKIFMYMEEVEWFYRAKLAGFKACFYNGAEIIHLGRGSSSSGKKEPILNIYRGLIYFYQKHKNPFELMILKIMLKIKAVMALFWGFLKNDLYLKETYAEAIRIN